MACENRSATGAKENEEKYHLVIVENAAKAKTIEKSNSKIKITKNYLRIDTLQCMGSDTQAFLPERLRGRPAKALCIARVCSNHTERD